MDVTYFEQRVEFPCLCQIGLVWLIQESNQHASWVEVRGFTYPLDKGKQKAETH